VTLAGPLSLSAWSTIAAAAACLVVAAYVLKMRRRRFEVPFSRLWQRVLEQRDASSLWKQLRRWLSLLLALFIAALVLFAVLDPTLGEQARAARNVVILLDGSASMKTYDGDPEGLTSRMQVAKAKAKELVAAMGGGDQAMVVRVDGQTTPLSRFSGDAPVLARLIDQVEASDTPADLTGALRAARDALRQRTNPLIVLISDGAFSEAQLASARWEPAATAPGDWQGRELAAVDLSGIDVRYLPVGHRADNVGIIAFSVRRYIANKGAYEVFIDVQNFAASPARRKLTLYNGDSAIDVRDLELPARRPGEPPARIRQLYPNLPSDQDHRLRAVLRSAEGPGGSDPFPVDDEAFALLPGYRTQKVLVVGEENLFLEGALLLYDNASPQRVSAGEYQADPSVAHGYDVVIFDEHTPDVMPPPPTHLVYFHPSGAASPIAIRGDAVAPRVTDIADDHPVMQWISLSDVNIGRSAVFAPDGRRGEAALAFSVRDPVIAVRVEKQRKILAFGFSLPAAEREFGNDLHLRVAFPLLIANALEWFAGSGGELIAAYSTGRRERVLLGGFTGDGEGQIVGPEGTFRPTPIIDGAASFFATAVGFHRVEAPSAIGQLTVEVAVNLASPVESDIAPSTELSLGGRTLAAPAPFAVSHRRQLWIYLLLVALGLLVGEWLTYHRRITV
jgi:hypothetical protein